MEFKAVVDGYHLEGMSVVGEVLWVSDVFDGGIRRCTPEGRIDVFLPERNMVGGILQNEGGTVLCSGRDGTPGSTRPAAPRACCWTPSTASRCAGSTR